MKVAAIWKEHGALSYAEYLGDDMNLQGTKSFPQVLEAKEDELIIFGWVTFPSKQARDLANERVATDPRMEALVAPLVDSTKRIFDASKMGFGGFSTFIDL